MKTKSVILGIVTFLFALAWGTAIAWLSGYNFANRNPDVGYGFALLSAFSFLAGAGAAAAHSQLSGTK